jgi:hypothetical protein
MSIGQREPLGSSATAAQAAKSSRQDVLREGLFGGLGANGSRNRGPNGMQVSLRGTCELRTGGFEQAWPCPSGQPPGEENAHAVQQQEADLTF